MLCTSAASLRLAVWKRQREAAYTCTELTAHAKTNFEVAVSAGDVLDHSVARELARHRKAGKAGGLSFVPGP